MKRFFLTVLTVVLAATAFAQSRQEHYESRLKKELKPENVKVRYEHYDFSTLIIPEGEFIGYIGPDFKRIKIRYTSVVRDETNKDQYHVKGISVVENNKCDFSGVVLVTGVYERRSMQYGVDSMYKDAGFRAQGIMVAEYIFREDPSQNHAGVFKGTMSVNWLVGKGGMLNRNHVYNYSDTFRDNQHVGTWTAYGISNPKPCNWGLRRIPFSDELDIGVHEFSPNPKYDQLGWAGYR